MDDLLQYFSDCRVGLFVTRESGTYVDGTYTVTTSYTREILALVPQTISENELIKIPLDAGESQTQVLVTWASGNFVQVGDTIAFAGDTYRVVKEKYRAESGFQRFVFAMVVA